MAIEIDRTALQALRATLEGLRKAVDDLASLDTTAGIPENRLYWIRVRNDGANGDDITKRLMQSMEATGKRRAAEMGAIMRADALDKATNEIEALRAVLCSQAAAATIELARIVRDARERG